MAFNRFAVMIIVRVLLLALTLIGLSLALTAPGYHATTLLLAAIAALLSFNLYRYVSRTNAELARFLEAVRYGDFGQRFQSAGMGAGFDKLSLAFSDIMQSFKTSRRQQQEQLRHLSSLTEHIPVPLLSLYPDDRIHLHNHAARRLFGNVKVNRLEDLNAFGEGFAEAIKRLEPGTRQLVNFSYDDMERQLAVMATQIVTGTITEHLISLQDIQSELDSAQLQAWQDLVRVLTHELMNSITPVASLAKTAADLVDDTRSKLNADTPVAAALRELEDVSRAVDTVARRADGMTQFVQGYRSLTLLPAPQKQTLLLADLFRRMEALLAADWAAKGIEFRMSLEPGNLQLVADPDLVEQVLINLLQNAEQALGDCKNPRVTLVGRLHKRGRVLLEVADNGPGIPADLANKIFIPFFTTKRQGSGVGLALTRQIMIAHGGGVTANPSATGGAKFTLSF